MKVEISNLTFKCIIGILPKERKKKQKVIINISFKYNFKEGEFIDYSHVAKDVETIMKKQKFQLIEDALIYIKERLETRYPIKSLKIKIQKPNILKKCQVSVEK